jgi:zinc transport system permease protein
MPSLDLLELIQQPFAQRVLLGGLLVALATGVMGFFVSLKRAHFFGDAIAHSSLAGIALGVLLDLNPLLIALIYALLIASILPWLQKVTELDLNNLLGIVLPFSMGLGVILFALDPGYQPELVSFLFGSIVWISWTDIVLLGLLLIILLGFLWRLWPKLTLLSIDPEYSRLLGIRGVWLNLIYNFLLALVIIAGVRLVGIVLVNALLIVPMSVAKLQSGSLKEMFWLGCLVSVFSVILGLLGSFWLNLPSGATIALVSGLVFGLAVLMRLGEKATNHE